MSVALVTGGSRGIGRAIVEEFACAGFDVAFTYAQNRDAAEAEASSLAGRERKFSPCRPTSETLRGPRRL